GERGAAEALAEDARVRRRSADDSAPTDGDRALRQLERGQASGRARTAKVRDAPGARAAATRAWRGARAHPNGERPRRAPRVDAVQVALLAHVRLALDCAARGGVRRAGGGGTLRARRRAGCEARAPAAAAAEVRGLGGGAEGG